MLGIQKNWAESTENSHVPLPPLALRQFPLLSISRISVVQLLNVHNCQTGTDALLIKVHNTPGSLCVVQFHEF